jgi:L-serine/L-threonine ammonia-lyase
MVNAKVWLKMEALQPTGSFKLRGVVNACRYYRAKGAEKFISSSGGNAGIAVAHCGRKLKIPVTVVVPKSTSQRAIDTIRQEAAQVIIKGKTWLEAHNYSLSLVNEKSFHIHPFDDPLLWSGHATMIDEVVASDLFPDIVILSVGGGGLLCGIIEGLHGHSMAHVPVLAVETFGADSLAKSLEAKRHIELEEINSIATSLGAKKVASAAYEWCQRHEVISHVVSDKAAVEAALQFSTDHRVLVEPACGASLSTLYNPIDILMDKKNILLIVCGGAGVTINQLEKWRQKLLLM